MDTKWQYFGVLLILLTALCCSGGEVGVESEPGAGDNEVGQVRFFENVMAEEAFGLINENSGDPDFMIVDIRTPEEFEAERIEGAVNAADFYATTFREDIDELDKDKTYLIYCRTGRRTGAAMTIMEELGFTKVYNMLGGISDWKQQGYETVN